MRKLIIVMLLCILLTGCTEQMKGSEQSSQTTETSQTSATASTESTTESTTITTTADPQNDEPIEVEIDDPLAGFVPLEHKVLYEGDAYITVLAADVPDENLDGTDADLSLEIMYMKTSRYLSWFRDPSAAGPRANISDPKIIYNQMYYVLASNAIYRSMSEFVYFLNDYLTEGYILSLLGAQSYPFIEYEGYLYAKDIVAPGLISLNGEISFYKVSQTDTQAIYEVYYWFDPEFSDSGTEGALKSYVVLQKENGRWLVADGGFWMDLF